MNFLILSSGLGWRIKSYEPRCMISVSGKSLLQRQVDQIRQVENSQCYLSYGYKPSIVKKFATSLGVTPINNKEYANTNQIESIRLFLSKVNTSGVFILHGDLVFSTDLKSFDYSSSFVLYNSECCFKNSEVGININDGYVHNLSYGLDTKWSQMFYVTGKELDILKNLCMKDNKYFLTFEVINYIIQNGGIFKAVPFIGKIYELDTVEEIKNADFNC